MDEDVKTDLLKRKVREMTEFTYDGALLCSRMGVWPRPVVVLEARILLNSMGACAMWDLRRNYSGWISILTMAGSVRLLMCGPHWGSKVGAVLTMTAGMAGLGDTLCGRGPC